jgi:glycosyltransferase involved in cell wall biosynthesis
VNIPLIIPCFNQLTYLRNIINWFRFSYPDNDIHIVDNGSTYGPLLEFLAAAASFSSRVYVSMCPTNNSRGNLRRFLDEEVAPNYEYYAISDPDIAPHPATPPNYLEIFRHCIDARGFHRAGFGLIIEDIPDWSDDKIRAKDNEATFKCNPVEIEFDGCKHIGHRAPIDTTFALYKSSCGWESPMRGEWWSNSIRVLSAFHLGWYLHPKMINPEMDNYFKTARTHVHGQPSPGENNYRPNQYRSQA